MANRRSNILENASHMDFLEIERMSFRHGRSSMVLQSPYESEMQMTSALKVDEVDTSEEHEEENIAYDPPPPNFIRVLHGASVTLDVCDREGSLLGMDKLDTNEYVDFLFQAGDTYLACITTTDSEGCLASVKPCLKHWEKMFPRMKGVFAKKIENEREEMEKKKKVVESSKESDKTPDVVVEKKKKGK